MQIQDIVAIPGHGTVLIVGSSDSDLEGLQVGATLSQGSHSWQVAGIERDRPRPSNVGVLVVPMSPIPHRGGITVVV